MKLFSFFILSAVLLFSLSACDSSSEKSATKSQVQPEPSSETKKSVSNESSGAAPSPKSDSPTNTKRSSENSTPSPQETQSSSTETKRASKNNESGEFFYGEWQIKKVIAYGAAGSYSSEDIDTLTGQHLTFSKDYATCFADKIEDMDKTITHPVYKKRVIAKDAFPANYRVTLDQLGINRDSVTELDATESNGNCTVTFITPDSHKLILFGGGTFFELDKVSNENNPTTSDEDTQNQAAIEEDHQNKAVSLVKDYLRHKNELEEDENHFVQFEETYNAYYIVRYSTLSSGHSSTNGRYAVDINKGKVIDISDTTDLDFLGQ
ncbi:hypothetical protein JOD43_003002 [Pullulanibacillus pueri]|uniref:hypothetical protein n=1 Tax=Pullulanibacillus pueri TaxID=1437324 RepID=UPI001663E736|nr:hypothetical protein [Pullulanibacillus pueri]MBM7682823.1 hypothetical protein [Pullulanibacillus pueri]